MKQKVNSKKVKASAEEEPRENEIQTDDKDELDEGEELQDEDIQHAIPEYGRLIAIHAGKLKGGIHNWFTQRNLLRVYPKGIRFDSSNIGVFPKVEMFTDYCPEAALAFFL
ncbi:hypothetical protein LOK49_LG09G02627 [Camellia lanceoleosa]|uniref:Uncharacterized protein n=1 Tax=Camellia lanceoleosa TaxID=1840588 RepID=A0ACC0GFA6_9ERIC|nr:hypothetical protein LOK49_LG09G02627 [Camellia lanceoleosa]